MQKYKNFIVTAILFIAMVGTAGFFITLPQDANACGYGTSGGNVYTPQRRSSSGYLAQKDALTPDQARGIVSSHIRKLNPDLEVGSVNDAGGFYEAEIISKDKEIVQLIGIDKFSGRLMLLQ
jgi:hypothetical protein